VVPPTPGQLVVPSVDGVHLKKEIPMATDLAAQAGTQPTTRSEARPLGQLLPGAAGLLYAGVQLEGGITAAVYRGISTVPDDRLSFPFSGSLATATSLTWGLTQALFLVTLLGFARSGAVGASRPGRIGTWLALVGGIVFVAAHAVSGSSATPAWTTWQAWARSPYSPSQPC
jgi:hypothetical protein